MDALTINFVSGPGPFGPTVYAPTPTDNDFEPTPECVEVI